MVTTSQQQRIDRLWELQEIARKNLQDIADHMGRIASEKTILPQERWNQLFDSWEQANNQMQKVGRALHELSAR